MSTPLSKIFFFHLLIFSLFLWPQTRTFAQSQPKNTPKQPSLKKNPSKNKKKSLPPPSQIPSSPEDLLKFPSKIKWASQIKKKPKRPSSRPQKKRQATPSKAKKKRLNEEQRLILFKGSLPKLSTRQLIERLRTRHWVKQMLLVDELVRRGEKARQQLYKALSHPHLRVRLLVAAVLAKLGDDRAIPMLLEEAHRLFDQPALLLQGVFFEYGPKIEPFLIEAMNRDSHRHIFLRILSLLRSPKILTEIAQLLHSPKKRERSFARYLLSRYPAKRQLHVVAKVLQKKLTADIRAELLRFVSYQEDIHAIDILLAHRQDPNESIRFLVRLSLFDKANNLANDIDTFKLMPPPKANASQALWQRWWKRYRPQVARWFTNPRHQPLKFIPQDGYRRTLLLYRTIHPMFGYGRMPILIHDARWKNPPAPMKGKLWRYPMPPKAFHQLVAELHRLKFFQMLPNSGQFRDLTAYYNGQKYKVSVGDFRYLAFERLERHFLKIAQKLKLGLFFNDLYRRPDEYDISREGKIGQWAFRSYDRLTPPRWSKRKTWRPLADLESTFAMLKDLFFALPTRTRLVSIDMQGASVRLTTLLFGTRLQSRRTFKRLERTRRLQSLTSVGIGVIYISQDKIEQFILDAHRMLIPNSLQKNPQQRQKLDLFTLLSQALPRSLAKVLHFSVSGEKPMRLSLMLKVKDSFSVLKILRRLALSSRGDRILKFRLNPSGEPDRSHYRLILQMYWEMLAPVKAPKRIPEFLKIREKLDHEPFEPIYR